MTSLIDVIFLLLLFFMLTSTFSRFSEVRLSGASAGDGARLEETRPLFVRLSPQEILLNGQPATLQSLPATLLALPQAQRQTLLVALKGEVSAQRLTDLLVALGAVPELNAKVLH